MTQKPLLSICIPALGRLEYVTNTLNSIYSDSALSIVDFSEFEVIISDNDENGSLKVLLDEFKYPNFKYFQTNCKGFQNSYFALTFGKGEFLKLHNSQELWNEGALVEMLNLIKINLDKKPFLFFSSGILMKGNVLKASNFNEFIYKTSYFTTWSNPFGIWKEDFDKIPRDIELAPIFPQTTILFTQVNKQEYLIIDKKYFTTQFVKKRKGYNKFEAFSVEYPSILKSSLNNNNITEATYKKILNDILYEFLPLLYFNVKIARREFFSSENFKENIKKYFPKGSYLIVILLSFLVPFKIIFRKIYMMYFLKSKF
jgi:hypothetical protein